MRYHHLAAALLLLSAGATRSSSAQTSPCLPADSGATWLLQYATGIIMSADARGTTLRTSLGITNVNASQVSLVTGGNDCTKARQAVDQIESTPNSSRRMHVVKVGSKRFFVWDPTVKAGEYSPVMVFDNKWVLVEALLAR